MENIKNLQEEIFCLNFELNSLAEVLIKNESERMMPNFCFDIIEHNHKERYKLAAQYSKDKSVLDIACGAGYGSFHIADKGDPKSVLGCDLSKESVRYATHRYRHEKLSYKEENAELFIAENSLDLIVSFETIEHLPNCSAFLRNTHKSLKKDGLFIVSTPISHLDFDEKPNNPYHTQEWGFESFQKLIGQSFSISKVYVQLYRHSFLNEKIDFEFKQAIKRQSLKNKIKNKIRAKIGGHKQVPQFYYEWKAKSNYPVIEEFTHQYNIDDLGKKHFGYQIIVCKKNE